MAHKDSGTGPPVLFDDPEYDQRFRALQAYIPLITKLMNRMGTLQASERKGRLQSLYKLLMDDTSKMNLKTLGQCENVLAKLQQKVPGNLEDTPQSDLEAHPSTNTGPSDATSVNQGKLNEETSGRLNDAAPLGNVNPSPPDRQQVDISHHRPVKLDRSLVRMGALSSNDSESATSSDSGLARESVNSSDGGNQAMVHTLKLAAARSVRYVEQSPTDSSQDSSSDAFEKSRDKLKKLFPGSPLPVPDSADTLSPTPVDSSREKLKKLIPVAANFAESRDAPNSFVPTSSPIVESREKLKKMLSSNPVDESREKLKKMLPGNPIDESLAKLKSVPFASPIDESREKLKKMLPSVSMSDLQDALQPEQVDSYTTSPRNFELARLNPDSPRNDWDFQASASPPSHWNPSPPNNHGNEWTVVDEYEHEHSDSNTFREPSRNHLLSPEHRADYMFSPPMNAQPPDPELIMREKSEGQAVESVGVKSVQNRLRAKMTEEISFVHRVGTSTGGSLRGLANKDVKGKGMTVCKEAANILDRDKKLAKDSQKKTEKITEIDMFSKEQNCESKKPKDTPKPPLKGLYAPRFSHSPGQSLARSQILSPERKSVSQSIAEAAERVLNLKSPTRLANEKVNAAASVNKDSSKKHSGVLANMTQEEIKRAVDLNLNNFTNISPDIMESVKKMTPMPANKLAHPFPGHWTPDSVTNPHQGSYTGPSNYTNIPTHISDTSSHRQMDTDMRHIPIENSNQPRIDPRLSRASLHPTPPTRPIDWTAVPNDARYQYTPQPDTRHITYNIQGPQQPWGVQTADHFSQRGQEHRPDAGAVGHPWARDGVRAPSASVLPPAADQSDPREKYLWSKTVPQPFGSPVPVDHNLGATRWPTGPSSNHSMEIGPNTHPVAGVGNRQTNSRFSDASPATHHPRPVGPCSSWPSVNSQPAFQNSSFRPNAPVSQRSPAPAPTAAMLRPGQRPGTAPSAAGEKPVAVNRYGMPLRPTSAPTQAPRRASDAYPRRPSGGPQGKNAANQRSANKPWKSAGKGRAPQARRNSGDVRKDVSKARPVPKEDVVSPLTSLYGSTIIPKTGKGYGLQKFKIPKIKRDPPPRARSPDPRPLTPQPAVAVVEQLPVPPTLPVTPDQPGTDKPSVPATSEVGPTVTPTEDLANNSRIDQDFVEALIKKTLGMTDTQNLLDNLKLLSGTLKSKKLNKVRAMLLDSSSDDSDIEVKREIKAESKMKKDEVVTPTSVFDGSSKSIVVSDVSDDTSKTEVIRVSDVDVKVARDSEESLKVNDEDVNNSAKPESMKVLNRRSLRSKNKGEVVTSEADLTDGSSSQLASKSKQKSDKKPVLQSSDEEEDLSVNDKPLKTAKAKRRNSLEILQADIRDMFISEGVLTSSGKRLCTMLKQDESLAIEELSSQGVRKKITPFSRREKAGASKKNSKRSKTRKPTFTKNTGNMFSSDAESEMSDTDAADTNDNTCIDSDSDLEQISPTKKITSDKENWDEFVKPKFNSRKSKKEQASGTETDRSLDESVVAGGIYERDDSDFMPDKKQQSGTNESTEDSDDRVPLPRPRSRASTRSPFVVQSSGSSDDDQVARPKRRNVPTEYFEDLSLESEPEPADKSNEKKKKKSLHKSKSVTTVKEKKAGKAKNRKKAKKKNQKVKFRSKTIISDSDESEIEPLAKDKEPQVKTKDAKLEVGVARIVLEKTDFLTFKVAAPQLFDASSSDDSGFEPLRTRRPASRSVARRGGKKFSGRRSLREAVLEKQAEVANRSAAYDPNANTLMFLKPGRKTGTKSKTRLGKSINDIIARLSRDVDGSNSNGVTDDEQKAAESEIGSNQDKESPPEVNAKAPIVLSLFRGQKKKRKRNWSLGVIRKAPKRSRSTSDRCLRAHEDSVATVTPRETVVVYDDVESSADPSVHDVSKEICNVPSVPVVTREVSTADPLVHDVSKEIGHIPSVLVVTGEMSGPVENIEVSGPKAYKSPVVPDDVSIPQSVVPNVANIQDAQQMSDMSVVTDDASITQPSSDLGSKEIVQPILTSSCIMEITAQSVQPIITPSNLNADEPETVPEPSPAEDGATQNELSNEAVEERDEFEPLSDDVVKNIDIDYVFHEDVSEKYPCKLCTFNGMLIVQHYVQSHVDSETYISRLANDDAQAAIVESKENNYDVAVVSPSKKGKRRKKDTAPFTCRICYVKSKGLVKFYEHLCGHTGEYRYKCNVCQLFVANKNSLSGHFYHHHKSVKLNYTLMHTQPTINKETVYAYLCSLCNFVQLSKGNVEKHVRLHHVGESGAEIVCINMHGHTTKNSRVKRPGRKTSLDGGQSAGVEDTTVQDEAAADVDLTIFVPTDKVSEVEKEKTLQDKRKNMMEEITKTLSNRDFLNCKTNSSLIDKLSKRNQDSGVGSDAMDQDTQLQEGGVFRESASPSDEREGFDADLSTNANDAAENVYTSTLDAEFAISDFGTNKSTNLMTNIIERLKLSTKVKEEMPDPDELQETQAEDDEDYATTCVGPFEAKHIGDALWFCCMIPGCDYTSIEPKCFKQHVSSMHTSATWDGQCQSCLTAVMDGGPVSVELAILHLIKYHLLINLPVTLDPEPVEGGSGSTGFRIRMRRLSGDKLSVAKDLDKSAEDEVNFPGCVIADVVSLADTPTVADASDLGSGSRSSQETEYPDSLPSSLTATASLPSSPLQLPFTLEPNSESSAATLLTPLFPPPTRTPVPFPSTAFMPDESTITVLSNETLLANLETLSQPLAVVSKQSDSEPYMPLPPKLARLAIRKESVPGLIGGSKLSENTKPPALKTKKIYCTSKKPPSPSPSWAFKRGPPVKLQHKAAQAHQARGLKAPAAYDVMLAHDKLRHLYKCMARECSWTGDVRQAFALHLMAAHEGLAPPCAYCVAQLDSAEELAEHTETEHGNCSMQCAYCFYRALSPSYVVLHQNVSHTSERLCVLRCRAGAVGEGADLTRPRAEVVQPYVCGQGSCAETFYATHDFHEHLRAEHAQLHIYTCQVCSCQMFDSRKLVAHYKMHSICLYQCPYCVFGSETIEEVHRHLCTSHANQRAQVVMRELELSDACARTRLPTCSRLKVIDLDVLEPVHETCIVEPPPVLLEPPPDQEPCVFEPIDVLCIVEPLPSDFSETDVGLTIPSQIPELITQRRESSSSLSDYTCNPSRVAFQVGPHLDSDLDPSSSYSGRLTRSSPDKRSRPAPDRPKEVPEKVPAARPKPAAGPGTQPDGLFEFGAITVEELSKTGLTGEQLYRCGYRACDYAVEDLATLRDHLLMCDFSRDSETVACPHCGRNVRTVAGLLEHLRQHGTMRFGCGLCSFRATADKLVQGHLKSRHRLGTNKTITIPLNRLKVDRETDLFVVGPLRDKAGRGGRKSAHSPAKKPGAIKYVYQPDEGHLLPLGAIYPYIVTCATCSFTTKVRTNMERHLSLHDSGHVVPSQTPVNAVPCLESNEYMFDKMTNLAASSNVGRLDAAAPTLTAADIARLPRYVPEPERYLCGAERCNYSSCDENMLLHHLRALHRDMVHYVCPHCPTPHPDEPPIPVDKLSVHLKMHDNRLYKCAYCYYYDYRRYVAERHSADKHRDRKPHLHVVRELPFDAPNAPDETTDAREDVARNAWRCGVCDFDCATRAEVMAHTAAAHNLKSQYKCGICSYRSQSKFGFEPHFASKHPGAEQQIVDVYYRVDGAPEPGSASFDTSPLWSRDLPRVKHIRGILFDEEEGAEREEVEVPVGPPVSPPGVGNMFSCNICKAYRTKYKSDMRHHLYREMKYFRLECVECRKKSCYRNHLMKHVIRAHPTITPGNAIAMLPVNKAIEEHVELVLATQQSLMQSLQDAATEAISPASVGASPDDDVDVEAEEADSVASKARRKRGLDTKPPRRFPCKTCHQLFRSVRGLKGHIRLMHLRAGNYLCNNCSVTQNAKSLMERHCKAAHPEVTADRYRANDPVLDTFDPAFWAREYDIGPDFEQRHPAASSVKRPAPDPSAAHESYKCKHCAYHAKGASDLKRHLMRHWVQKPFSCGHCDFEAIRHFEVRKHSGKIHPYKSVVVVTNQMPERPDIQAIRVKRKPDLSELADDAVTDPKKSKVEFATDSLDYSSDWETKEVCAESLAYKCVHCEFHDAVISVVHKHWLAVHKGVDGLPFKVDKVAGSFTTRYGQVRYKCGYCAEQGSHATMVEHQKGSHFGLEASLDQWQATLYSCSKCKYSTHLLEAMMEHQATLHDPSKIACGYVCLHCSRIVNTLGEMLRHHTLDHPGLKESFEPRGVAPSAPRVRSVGTARKSTTHCPRVKMVARKSTGNSPRKKAPWTQPWTFYGREPRPVDAANITVRVTLGQNLVDMRLDTYMSLVQTEPVVLVDRLDAARR